MLKVFRPKTTPSYVFGGCFANRSPSQGTTVIGHRSSADKIEEPRGAR